MINYKYKYEKYKTKNKKIIVLFGGQTNFSLDTESNVSLSQSEPQLDDFYKLKHDEKINNMFELFDVNLSKDDVDYFFKQVKNTIDKHIINDAKNFIKLCNFVEKRLNALSKNKTLNVFAPGDSPTKIIEYFKKLNKCKNCNFIMFSFSRYGNNENYMDYLESKLPDSLDDFVIFDYIETGRTLLMISDALENKFGSNNVTNKIRDYLNGKINKTKYVLNLDNEFTNSVFDYIVWSERTYTRCIPYNKKNIELDNLEKHDNIGCMFFIYIAILCTLYPDIADNYLYNEQDRIEDEKYFYEYKFSDKELKFLELFD